MKKATLVYIFNSSRTQNKLRANFWEEINIFDKKYKFEFLAARDYYRITISFNVIAKRCNVKVQTDVLIEAFPVTRTSIKFKI